MSDQWELYHGDCKDYLKTLKDNSVQLIVTSPPYNLGKEYETKCTPLNDYLLWQTGIILQCHAKLKENGSICWQLGNYVEKGEVFPLDLILYDFFKVLDMKLRNRIVWQFGHGLHCSKRFSGRYETIMWFTKSDEYVFNLDCVRVPQKYPGKKHFKGDKAGQLSCNPLGKNPSDVWDIPNVKHNHVEKVAHPCQFPIALVQRLILALSNEGDLVIDPFAGSGTTLVAGLMNGRRVGGAEIMEGYYKVACERIESVLDGSIKAREDIPVKE